MFSYVNPIPIVSYLKNSTPEHSQIAIELLQKYNHLFLLISKIARKFFLILATCSLVSFILQSRDIIRQDEKSQLEYSEEAISTSVIEILSKLFFSTTVLSGFAYLYGNAGSYITSYGITWIASTI